MSDAHRQLVDAKIAEIIEHEGMAQKLAEFADLLERDGHHTTAETLRDMSRSRRVKGIELRGNLAAFEISNHKSIDGDD